MQSIKKKLSNYVSDLTYIFRSSEATDWKFNIHVLIYLSPVLGTLNLTLQNIIFCMIYTKMFQEFLATLTSSKSST